MMYKKNEMIYLFWCKTETERQKKSKDHIFSKFFVYMKLIN